MTSLPVTRPAPELPAGPRAALVVAIGSYTDAALTRLDSTARDATEMADVLADPDIGSFEVTSVVDRTAQEIRLAVEDFLEERHRGDLVVVYLSCHGVLDKQDRLYFAATDTRKDRLASTGVEAEWLWNRLEECRAARQVVILDCCNSGAFGRAGGKGEAADLRLPERFITQGRGRAVLTASRANQRSWEGDPVSGEAGPSAFTSALVEGLRTGAADTDGDGYISVDDAYVYAYRKVIESGVGQVPQRSMSTGEGTLLLARNPAGLIITPAQLPEDLRAALDSPQPAIRAGAVNALGDWLTGPDPARALTADQTLRRIATTEVPAVAAAARAHLSTREARQDTARKTEEPAPREAQQDTVGKTAPTPVREAQDTARKTAEPAPREAQEDTARKAEAVPVSARESSSGAARLLTAGFIILAIALFLAALDILLKTFPIWPWWAITGLSIAGIAITPGGVRQDAISASFLLFNLPWFVVYSLSIITSHSTATANILVTECAIGAAVNVALCTWIAVLHFKGTHRPDPLLAILAGGSSIGLVLAAIANGTNKLPVWNAVAIVTIANALVCLLVSARVLRQNVTSSQDITARSSSA